MWTEAACKKETAAFRQRFFSDDLDDQRSARQVCVLCPVVSDCLEFALETNQTFFLWGGMSSETRRRLVRKRRATA